MNEQEQFWVGKHGNVWTERLSTFEGAYSSWEADSGVKLKDLLQEFFHDIHRDSRILELGCGPGWVLRTLQELKFNNLVGCDINNKAIDMAKEIHTNIQFVQRQANKLDLRNVYDLILTSAFLIHTHPDNLDDIMARIYNASSKYIFGRELSSTSPEECPIENTRKGKWENQYWTRRFKDKWLELYPDLKVVKYKLIPMMSKQYIQTEVYLLEK